MKPILPQSSSSFGPQKDGKSSDENLKPPGEENIALPEESSVLPFPLSASDSSLPVKRDFDETHRYYHVLNQVVDPETGIGIVDMGLIYHVEEHDGIVSVTMTLTSMGCPAGPQLTTDIDAVLRLEKGVIDVEIEVVWEPAWNPDMMNQDLRQMLFGNF